MHRNGGGAIGDLLPLPLLAAPLGMGSSLVLMGWWFGEHMGKSAFQRGLKLHPLVSSPTILSANMWDTFHLFLVFTYTKDFYGLYHESWCLVCCHFLFCLVLLFNGYDDWTFHYRTYALSSELVPGIFYSVCSSLSFLLDLNLGPESLLVGLIICQVSSIS